MNSILELKAVRKEYKNQQVALKGINLTIQEGEFVVIIGPSGAGKSTLIRTINQLVTPTSGEVLFKGKSLTKASKKELRLFRSKIGMIFQHYNLINRTNVLKNVLHGKLGQVSLLTSTLGLYSQEDRQQAVALLKTVGLEEHLYKRAGDLSGGQMQRVGICRAIMQEPDLILADEPIASLDPKSAKKVMSHLKSITEEKNLTCIVNLHQVEVAKEYATRIIGVKAGEIVFDGTPKELSDEAIKMIYDVQEEIEPTKTVELGELLLEESVYG